MPLAYSRALLKLSGEALAGEKGSGLDFHVVEAFALSGFVFYSLYFAVIVQSAGVSAAGLVRALGRALPQAAAWILASLVVVYVLAHYAPTHG